MAEPSQQHPRPEPGSDYERFARLVRLLRTVQAEYFRTRHPALLKQSKEIEARVDVALVWLLGPLPGQAAAKLPGIGDDEPEGAYSGRRPVRSRPIRRR